MWEQFQRYRALDPLARRLFWSSVRLLPMIRVSLRSRGYKKTQEWLQRRLCSTNANVSQQQEHAAVPLTCRMVNAGAHYGFIRPTCLEESLALLYFLRAQGIAPQIRIGVRKTNGKFEAHAWVEYQGETLNQSQRIHEHYAAFDNEFSEPPAGTP